MSGQLARILAQLLIVGVNIASKAFLQAVANARAGGGKGGAAAAAAAMRTAGARMPLDQARQILNVESNYTKEEVLSAFTKYYEANDPDKGGSFYVQSKIWNAKEALLDELKRNEATRKAADGAASERPDDSARAQFGSAQVLDGGAVRGAAV